MMKKHVLVAGLVVGAMTGVQANSCTHGAYIGAGVGGVIAHHTSNSFSFTPAAGVAGQTFNPDFNKTTAGIGLLVGYAWKIQSWHLGVEIDYLFANLKTKFNQTTLNPATNNANAAVNANGAFGAAFRVGYHWDRFLGYVRLGIENRRFKITANLPINLAIAPNNTLSASASQTAFAPGIGAQFFLTKNVSTTLEYRTAFYRAINKSLTTVDGTTNVKVKPRVSTVFLSVRYHF